MVLQISNTVSIPLYEITFSAIRAQGAGGQNVNKVATAVQLRFDINNSSLPAVYKERLLQSSDQRITKDGVIIIKAQRFRTQEKNKDDALQRLKEIIKLAGYQKKTRTPTKPSRTSRQRRINSKVQKGKIKVLRGKIKYTD